MEIKKHLDNFCEFAFWDDNVTWNTNNPDFTSCFEDTVLTWIPCAFLWIFLPLEVYYLRYSQASQIPLSIYNITKLVLIGLMSTLVLIDSIYYSFIQSTFSSALITSAFIKFFTFILFLCLTCTNMKCGINSSGILFLFSLILVLCGAPKYRTNFINYHDLGILPFLTYFTYYPITIVVLLLNCFCDTQPKTTPQDICPEYYSSFLSKLWFSWFSNLVWKGYRKSLTHDDLWSLDHDIRSAAVVDEFEKSWSSTSEKSKRIPQVKIRIQPGNRELRKNSDGNVSYVEYKIVKSNKPSSISTPLYRAYDAPMWRGYFYAFLLLVISVIQTLFASQYAHRINFVCLRIRTALVGVCYKKTLTLSNRARRDFTVGEIANLMSVDVQHVTGFIGFANWLWSAPLHIFLALFFLWQYLGPSVLAGLAVMIITIPLNGWVASKTKNLQIKQMKFKDERIKLMNEILSGIKVLKLYAWEQSFEKQVLDIRNEELKVLIELAYLSAASFFLLTCTPFVVSLVTFGAYALSSDENILDAKTAFVSLSLFNLMRFPVSMLPNMISNLIQAGVSVKRISKFLNSEDRDPNNVFHKERSMPLSIEKADFSWEGTDGCAILRNIDLKINSGCLVAVVGPVGSGKSSLISAFLGEMYKLSGSVNTSGTIAYVPQQAWIRNATLRDNVTFGEQSKDICYENILSACALDADLEILPAGDLTEIGEKGINLSGGQKQRISLARAVYFNADIYLLDDPLSAVDSRVGKHIFEHVIGPRGLLGQKTRILVTHNVTILPQCDLIVVLKDGTISEMGTFEELIDEKSDSADFLLTYLKDKTTESVEGEKNVNDRTAGHRSKNSDYDSIPLLGRQANDIQSEVAGKRKVISGTINGQKLVETEHAETGNIKWGVYAYYLTSVGVCLSIATIAMNLAFQGFSVGSSMWLSEWSSDNGTVLNGSRVTNKTYFYLVVYASLGFGQAASTMLGSLVQAYGTLKAAKLLHNLMLTHILRAPLEFFDTTPIGRIVNRFGKDINTLDVTLTQSFRTWLMRFFGVMSILFIISYSTPVFMFVILPIGAFYFFVQRFYVATSIQLKRMESVSNSPIYSHFSETVTGSQSIRAYGLQKNFIQQCDEKVDFSNKIHFASRVSNRWLSVRLETSGDVIIFFAALFAVLQRGKLSPGLVGLSISYALQITEWLNGLLRTTSDMEANIVAVERIKEYGETPPEAAWQIENQVVPDDWPTKGEIKFDDFRVRYRDNLDLVLRGLTFSVNGGKKVGIVGRTGAGKSSLTLSLFRIIESAGGSISIDDIDISTLGLHTLRSRITIIPQDPVLFSGTLRINIDPMGLYSDENIWHALELVHLKTYISSLKCGLEYEVIEGGDNFSVGQRQLICLARALLRKTKILILDEATAAIDLETDDLIQSTIRKEFKACTILTIAHRLNTVMDYDRIIVLDNGIVVEFDTPSALLESKDSTFYSMAADAGLL